MADKTEPTKNESTEKAKAVEAYLSATTREAKADVVKKYPILSEIFSAINHS